ncbi:MAG: XkdX family protein [Lachnospiraceae bacterium]|nr:XkdX family protein [Lachnospiraceae bacterium]
MAKKTATHSPKYDYLKEQYERNYITKATLKKYVLIGLKKPANGITADEYEEITGEPYES